MPAFFLSPQIPVLRRPEPHQSWQSLLKMPSSFSRGKGWLEAKVAGRLSLGAPGPPAKISYASGGRFAVGTASPSAWSLWTESTEDTWIISPARAVTASPIAHSWETGNLRACWVVTQECFTSPRAGLLNSKVLLPGAKQDNACRDQCRVSMYKRQISGMERWLSS